MRLWHTAESETLPHGTGVGDSESAGDVVSDGSDGRVVWLPRPWRPAGLASRATATPARSHVPQAGTGAGGGREVLCSEVRADDVWLDGGTRVKRGEEPCGQEGLRVLLLPGASGFSPGSGTVHDVLLPQCSQRAWWDRSCGLLLVCDQPFLRF